MIYVDPVVLCSFFDLKTFQRFQLTSKDSLKRLNTHWIAFLVQLRREHGEVLYPRLISSNLPVLQDSEALSLFRYETNVDCFKTTRVLIEYYNRNKVLHLGILKEVVKVEEYKSHFLRMIASTPRHVLILDHILERVVKGNFISYFAKNNPLQWTLCVSMLWETVALYGNTAAAIILQKSNMHPLNPIRLRDLAMQHMHSGYTICQHGHCSRHAHQSFINFMSGDLFNFQHYGLHYPEALEQRIPRFDSNGQTMQIYDSEHYVDVEYSDDDFLPFIDYLDEDSDEDSNEDI